MAIRIFTNWAIDFTTDKVVDGNGRNAQIRGISPLNTGDFAHFYFRPCIYLGGDGNGGGIFRDFNDGSFMHVSETDRLFIGNSIPEITDDPLQI